MPEKPLLNPPKKTDPVKKLEGVVIRKGIRNAGITAAKANAKDFCKKPNQFYEVANEIGQAVKTADEKKFNGICDTVRKLDGQIADLPFNDNDILTATHSKLMLYLSSLYPKSNKTKTEMLGALVFLLFSKDAIDNVNQGSQENVWKTLRGEETMHGKGYVELQLERIANEYKELKKPKLADAIENIIALLKIAYNEQTTLASLRGVIKNLE